MTPEVAYAVAYGAATTEVRSLPFFSLLLQGNEERSVTSDRAGKEWYDDLVG